MMHNSRVSSSSHLFCCTRLCLIMSVTKDQQKRSCTRQRMHCRYCQNRIERLRDTCKMTLRKWYVCPGLRADPDLIRQSSSNTVCCVMLCHCLNERHQQAFTVLHLMHMQLLAGCTQYHQHSRKVLTLSGAGLGLVALHVLQALQEGQVVPPDGLHLPPGSLGLLPRLHPYTT